MAARLNTLYNQDCMIGLKRLDDGVVDLAFAGPPFNMRKVKQGDPIGGAAGPLLSAPSTARGRELEDVGNRTNGTRRKRFSTEQRTPPNFENVTD